MRVADARRRGARWRRGPQRMLLCASMRVRSRLLASRVLPFAIFVAFVALRVAYWHPAGEMRDDDYVSATAVLFHGRIDPSWGPLYSLWLWAFRNLVGLVALPLASWALIVLANLVIGWRIARLAGASPIAATVAPLPCAAARRGRRPSSRAVPL